MLIIHIWLQVCLQKVHWKYTQGSGNVHRVVLQFYIQTRKIDSMLHSLTSRQNAKYSSSSVQKGRAIHTLQGGRGSEGKEGWGRAELLHILLTVTK